MTAESDRPTVQPPNAVLLGIDCGGSHTAVVVGDAGGRVLARAEGPGSAMRPGGAELSAAVILDVARRAATQAQVSLPASVALVSAGVLVLRFTEPARPRPFKVAWVWVVAPLSVVLCVYVMLGLPGETWIRFAVWLAIGLALYVVYGFKHSKIRQRDPGAGSGGPT